MSRARLRETIAFSRRRQNGADKLAVYYRRESKTRMIPAGTKHDLVYAY